MTTDYPPRHAAEPETRELPPWQLPVPEPRHDAFAGWSLGLALLWGFGISSVLAVVFALASYSSAKRHGRPPSAFATGGLILGLIGISVTMTVIIMSAL
jgi:hypothetical protein